MIARRGPVPAAGALDPRAYASLCARWGVPGLEAEVSIRVSARLTRSLGRADIVRGRVTLHPALLDRPDGLLDEVIVHELAHLAAARLNGSRRIRPHGQEWRELMTSAGYTPRATTRVPGWPASPPSPRRRSSWRHTCTACRAWRVAGRPMRRWRCARCLDAGHGGELTIERIR